MSVHIESAGRGRPLVLLHGWAMHSGFWMPLVPRLVDRFHVHMVDLPGHGYSDPVAPYTLGGLVDAVATAVAALPAITDERPTLLGWSLGGVVALEWARSRPGVVRALVLTATTPCFVRRPDWPQAMAAATMEQFGDELVAAYRLTLQRFLTLQVQGSDRGRVALAQLRGRLLERGEPSRAALGDALELLSATDLRAEVGAIQEPTLIIAGDHDTLVPHAAARWLASALPHASLALIPGAAHTPFLSHPDAFLAAVDRFCDEH
jgi:pimeloyl-[acyl-carrier protein] methyl ester esterase